MFAQDGGPVPVCTRGLLRRTQAELAERGLTALVGAEVELVIPEQVGRPWNAYGLGAVLEVETFVLDLLEMCAAVGLPVEQVHAEYGAGQFEFSLSPTDPLTAADNIVLARLLAGRVARRNGLSASFSPQPFAGGAGNGAHQHLSLFRDGVPLFSGGAGPHGLTPEGEAAIAGIVAGLPELLGVFAGSALSAHRLRPGHWSGAFACWGLENREAAVRFVTGPVGHRQAAANVEVKCFDAAANPYLLMAGLLAAGRAGMAAGATLPAPVGVDPATLTDEGRREAGIRALPTSLEEAVRAFEQDDVLTNAFGEELAATIVDVRRGEIAALEGRSPEDVAAALRWVH
jgi:glutamine synthetase